MQTKRDRSFFQRFLELQPRAMVGLIAHVLVMGLGIVGECGKCLAADEVNPVAVLQDLKSFKEVGSVLMIAAHPDDENTQLITYLARGRGYRMAYLSVTRGDGGQNLLGAEFSEELGVIRTQELLAARRLDGGQQFFTRAIDFGFSKDVKEALRIWDHEQILGDVVRVIRTFRPDVIVTRFSPQASNTHGQHTASAVLGVEAFKLAGDPKAYPEQLDRLKVWQPKRVLLNGGGGGPAGRGGNATPGPGTVRIDAGGTDAVLGVPLSDIAGQSRAMHKSQGFGNFGARGGGAGGPRFESFQLLAGEPATQDIMDGVNLNWSRFEGGLEIEKLAEAAVAKFDANNLAANVPALLKIQALVRALPDAKTDRVLTDKDRLLTKILKACLGLAVETQVAQAEVVPGETLAMTHHASLSGKTPVKWVGMQYPEVGRQSRTPVELTLKTETLSASQKLNPETSLSQPYWLRSSGSAGMYRADDPAMIGEPENAPVYPVAFEFEVLGQTLVIPDEPVYRAPSDKVASLPRRLDAISPVTVRFASEVRVFAPGSTRDIEVELTSYRAGAKGNVELKVPAKWKYEPATLPFELPAVGDRKTVTFKVTAPNEAAEADITAAAIVNGARFDRSRTDIRYDHIPVLVMQPLAQTKAISLDLAIRGKRVGYIAGAGDSIAEALLQMGYMVVPLTVAEITAEKLRDLDAVVVGVRAFNVHRDLLEKMPIIFAFVEAGGNLIEQYNRPDNLPPIGLTPFNLRVSSLRVTDENAAMRFLVPDHPVLNTPNKITVNDFLGWVQERGIYFPNQWDVQFTPIIACNDPDEQSLEGGLLVAPHGKGHIIYTSFVWFRELPAGVPGAYRLFANLVSLGK